MPHRSETSVAAATLTALAVLVTLPCVAVGGSLQGRRPLAVRPTPSPSGAHLPALSLVRSDDMRQEGGASATAARISLYSRDLNRPLCASSEVKGDIYVGTSLGLKVMRRNPKTSPVSKQTRLYTTKDGLPSDYIVQVLANDTGVWCVALTTADGSPVKARPGGVPANLVPLTYYNQPGGMGPGWAATFLPGVALCQLDRKTDRWKVLKRVPLVILASSTPAETTAGGRPAPRPVPTPPPFWGMRQYSPPNDGGLGERAIIAVTEDQLCFAPGRTRGTDDVPLLYLLDRKTNVWTEVRPERGLNTLPETIVVSSLDVRDRKIFLGTSHGMLCYDTKAQAWTRSLPEWSILARGNEPGGTMQLAVRRRAPKNAREAMWLLLRFDPSHPLAEADDLLPIVKGDTPEDAIGTSIGNSPTGISQRALQEEPIGVTVESGKGADNAIWVTTRILPGLNAGWSGPYGAVRPLGSRLYCYGTQQREWSRYALFPDPVETRDNTGVKAQFYQSQNAESAAGMEFPPDVARPLALFGTGRSDNSFTFVGVGSRFYQRVPLDTPEYWRDRYFAAWQSASANLPESLFQDEGRKAAIWPPSRQPVSDPYQSTARWSISDGQIIREANTAEGRRVWSPVGKTVQYQPRTYRICATGNGGSGVLAINNDALYTLDPGSGECRRVPLPDFLSPSNSGGVEAISVLPSTGESDDASVVLHHSNDPFLIRYDLKTRQFGMVGDAPRRGSIVAPAGPGAVWMRVEDADPVAGFVRVPTKEGQNGEPVPSEAAPVIRIPKPEGYPDANLRWPAPLATSRNILWFAFRSQDKLDRSENCVILGYNTEKAKWVPGSLRVPMNISYVRRGSLLSIDAKTDDMYAAAPRPDGSVFRFDTGTGQWSPLIPAVPPPVPPSEESSQPASLNYWRKLSIISVTPEEVWLAGNPAGNLSACLLRFDRRKEAWSREDFPAEFRSIGDDMDFALVGGRIVVGQQTLGLRVFDPATNRWSAPAVTAKLSSRYDTDVRGQTISYSFQDVTLGEDAIWAVLQLDQASQPIVARLDKQSGEWRFWGAESLGNLSNGAAQILPDRDTAWLRTSHTLLRYVPAKKDWETVNPAGTEAVDNNQPVVYPDTDAVWLMGTRQRESAAPLAGTAPLPGGRRPLTMESVLWRWDRQTGAYDAYPLPPSAPKPGLVYSSSPSNVLVEKDTLYIASGAEVLVFDKRERKWSSLPFPESFPPVTVARITRGEDGILYIVNDTQVVRYETHVLAVKEARLSEQIKADSTGTGG